MMSLMIWWLLWLLFGQGFTMKMGWNEELEFCEEEWKKFVADKIEIDSKCNNTRTRCCVEEKKYLLERFKMFSEICPLEGTCGCSPIILNFTFVSHVSIRYHRLIRKAISEKRKEPENFTCSHKFINERVEQPPYRIRYDSFGIRKYKYPYKYVLYGGKNHTCYVVINVNQKQDMNGFFIKHVQSGKCVVDSVPLTLLHTMYCFEESAYFKFLQSGSINRLNTTRCLMSYGFYVDLSHGNFNAECGAINTITQTNWGSVTCDGKNISDVSCSNNQYMVIKVAEYRGLRNGSICGSSFDYNCSVDVTCDLKNYCDGERKCNVTVDDNHFPSNICPGLEKYLYFEYQCNYTNYILLIIKELRDKF
ncbi:uncharacterized protein LOC124452269 [Xenia sp. Carnegie-2017]|uniref:uncharacterized protein LOC124452269 n=1 Tax=Xenia sp. Carnegie-2017 TaxID=2897299 RepID=UPI001F04963F|nr:uncharacterized protein LOC124452269 [Xenia sp. Carnegie-2017]